jgi:hypothetical protein
MAKIKESDIFEGNIFEQNAKSASDLLDVVIQLQKAGKAKLPLVAPESSEEINELTDNLKKLELQRKIGEEQRKIATANAKKEKEALDKQIGTLGRLQKRNSELTRERKQLNLETANGRKRLQEINSELDKNNKFIKDNSDKLTQNRLSIGGYKDAINEAVKSNGAFGSALNEIQSALGSLNKIFASNLEAITANTAALQAQEGATKKVIIATKLVGNIVKVGIVGAIVATVAALGTFFSQFEDGLDAIDRFKLQFIAVFAVIRNRIGKVGEGIVQIFTGITASAKASAKEIKLAWLEATNFAGKNRDEIKKTKEEIKSLEAAGVTKGINTVKTAFDGLGDEISRANEEAKKLFEEIDNFDKKVSRLAKIEIEELSGKFQLLQKRSSDLTLSFKDREEAEKQAFVVSNKLLQTKLQLAEKDFDFAVRKAALERGVTEKQLRDRIKLQEALGTIREKDLNELIDFQTEIIAINNEIAINKENLEAQGRSNDEKRAKVRLANIRENAELELKILSDLAKSNEKSFEQRTALANAFERKSKEQLDSQIATLQELTQGKINVDELLLLNATELEERLELIGLGVKNTKELGKILVDYKKDLVEVSAIQKKIADDQEKIRLRNEKAEQNIDQSFFAELVEREKRIFNERRKASDLLNKKEVEALKRNIQVENSLSQTALEDQKEFELSNKDLTEKEILEIENKFRVLSEKLEREQLDRINQLYEEARIARINQIERTVQQISGIVESELDKIEQLEQASFERRQAQRDKDIELQRQRAVNGQKNTFAELEALRIQEELKRQQQERRDARRRQLIKDVEVFTEAYLTNLKVPNTTSEKALLKTAQDQAKFKALTAVVGGLLSAKDGVEDTGKGGNLDKDGGFLAKLHPNERVLTKEQNEPLLKMGVKNADLPDLVALGVMAKTTMPNLMQSIRLNSKDILATKIDELKEVIENKTEYRDFTDKHGNHIAEMITKGNKRVVKYQRAKPRF